MKICPTCQTEYDEEILRFCIKDGSALVEKDQPQFTEMPSDSIEQDDIGEDTIIRRINVADLPPLEDERERSDAPRIIIETSEIRREHQSVRPRPAAYQAPPSPPNITKVIVLTVIGTAIVLGGIGGLIWFLQSDQPAANTNVNANVNLNANVDTNLNTNLNLNGYNLNLNMNMNSNANANVNTNLSLPLNVNANVNMNSNVNANANLKTPTPKPSPTVDENANTNAGASPTPNAGSPVPTPSATPSLRALPSPTTSRTPSAPPSARPANNGPVSRDDAR